MQYLSYKLNQPRFSVVWAKILEGDFLDTARRISKSRIKEKSKLRELARIIATEFVEADQGFTNVKHLVGFEWVVIREIARLHLNLVRGFSK